MSVCLSHNRLVTVTKKLTSHRTQSHRPWIRKLIVIVNLQRWILGLESSWCVDFGGRSVVGERVPDDIVERPTSETRTSLKGF